MIELLQAMGLDDISAAVWGFLVGATLVAVYISGWFVGEEIVNRLLEPGFDAHADQAIVLTVEQPPCPSCGERCDDCGERMCTEYGPEPAPTCDAHLLCADCDDVSNTCSACREARAIAIAEASA